MSELLWLEWHGLGLNCEKKKKKKKITTRVKKLRWN